MSCRLVVRLDYFLYQSVADDIRLRELNDRNASDVLQPGGKAASGKGRRAYGRRQVDLRRIARNYNFGALAHPRQKHLHLRHGRILAFVQNDERFVERPAAHVGQRHHFDNVLLHMPLDLIEIHHFVQGVEQRTKIRVDLRA